MRKLVGLVLAAGLLVPGCDLCRCTGRGCWWDVVLDGEW